jgi:hypothetical protein
MIAIHRENLQVGKTYYIDCSKMPQHIRSNSTPDKIKAVCSEINIDDISHKSHVLFKPYKGVKSLEFCCYRNRFMNEWCDKYISFYEVKKQEILEKKERETVNIVLQNITGDMHFCFYE